MLLPPPVDSPVRHLAFATNSGRLLSIHAPGTACIWDLRDSVRLEARSKLTEPSGTDAVISIAKMIPGSSLALLGTAEGTALAYDVVEGKAAPWSLGCGDGPLCALEANPLEPRRVLAGQKRGALQVFELAPGGGARVCSFAAPSEQAGGDEPGLCCATWSARQLLAGYDDGRVLVHSVRNPAAPNATILVNPFGAGPRRPLRSLSCAGGPVGAQAAGGGGAAMAPVVYATGGTLKEQDPDGLVLLRGEGLKDRAMVVTPRAAALVAAPAGGTSLLRNGQPAEPSHLYVLSSAGELFRFNLASLGSAPTRYPGASEQPCEQPPTAAAAGARIGESAPRVLVSAAAVGLGRCQVHLFVATAHASPRVLQSNASPPPPPPPPPPPAPAQQPAPAVDPHEEEEDEVEAMLRAADEALRLAATAADAAAADAAATEEAAEAPATSAATAVGAATPASAARAAAAPAARARSPAVPGRGAFFRPVTIAPHAAGSGSAGAAAAKGVLSQGLGWLQAAGQQAESAASRGSASARLLGQSLSWISRELAPEPTPSMADELRPVFFPPPPPPPTPTAATPQTPGDGSSAGGKARTEQQARDALLGGGKPAAARQPTAEDGPAGRAARGARRAAGAMGESLDAAVERGEKLNQLGDKSQQLADDAEDFANLAKQLRQNQEKGFFGQLFG